MRQSIFLSLIAAALLFGASTPVHAQKTWADFARENDEKVGRSDAVYGKWDTTALMDYNAFATCLHETPSDCSPKACRPIGKKLQWLGAMCEAEAARAEGKQSARERALERAYRLFVKQPGVTRQFLDDRSSLSMVDSARGESRAYSIGRGLNDEINGYTAWATGQVFKAKHAQELAELERRASTGDAKAQFELGVKLYNDKSQSKNLVDAAAWYRKAADQGVVAAQFNLGLMFAKGEGVPEDLPRAVELYRKAADQGDAGAQNNLGTMYRFGQGVPQDNSVAAAWYRKSAEQDNEISQNNLGDLYWEGSGVPKDFTQAVSWYRKAAEQGNASAQYSLGFAYKHGNGVANDLAQAVSWYRKAAEQGHANSQNDLGAAYEFGNGVPKDPAQSVSWYRMAAEQGNGFAQFNLGRMYEAGEAVEKDQAQAVAWYRKSAEQGNAHGQRNLAITYANGVGVPKNLAEAVVWYRKAADQGDATAQNGLGLAYHYGNGVAKDARQAESWYRKAADQGHAAAQNNLGTMYEDGEGGLLEDVDQAAPLYRNAATQGDAYGQRNLARLYRRGLGVPKSRISAYAWMNLAAAGGHENAPADRDAIAAELSAAELQKAQSLSRAWKPGQSIPEIKDAASRSVPPTSAASTGAARPQSSGPFPARPAKQPGRVSCNTRCSNGDCYRTYDDGRQIRIRAEHKLNAFGDWEWDAGPC